MILPFPSEGVYKDQQNKLTTIMYYYIQYNSTIAHCLAVEPTVYVSVLFAILASSLYMFPYFAGSVQAKHWPLKTHGS